MKEARQIRTRWTDRSAAETGNTVPADAISRQALLVCSVGKNKRVAIPVAKVSERQQIPRSRLEKAGNQDVVQYQGGIMPLIYLSHFLSAGSSPAEAVQDPLQVLIYTEQGRSVGLVVGGIFETVEEMVRIRTGAKCEGILGCTVIRNKVMDLVDVPGVIRAADPTFFERPEAVEASA